MSSVKTSSQENHNLWRGQESSPAGGKNKGASIFVDEPETADLIGKKKTTQLESLKHTMTFCKISSLTI